MMIKRNKMMNTRLNLDKRPYYLTYSVHCVPVTNNKNFSRFTQLNTNPFLQHIPSEYIQSKEKALNIYFNFYELNYPAFNNKINSNVTKGLMYTVYIKVRYNIDSFFMLGNQFGFDFSSEDKIYDLLGIVNDRLEEAFEEYSLIDESVVYVQLIFRRLDTKLLSVFSLDKSNHISSTDINSTKRKLNIPVSVSEDSLGKPLGIIVENNKIIDIILNFNNKRINFLDVIRNKAKFIRAKHSDNITDFDASFKFYLLKDVNYYILAVKYIEKSSLEKIRYSLDGVVINRVIDIKDNNNLVVRKSGEKEILIANNKVLMTKQNIKLKCIEKPNSNVLFIGNPNIGVIDTETFLAKDNKYKIYALGFKTNLVDSPIIYYINEDHLDSDNVVLSMINELLRPKYDKITFYCHNLSGFDVVFILKVLDTYNENNNDKYNISPILREDKIIKITISKNNRSFTIMDSYCMLADSLNRLGKNFEVNTLKSVFPYKFSTEDHLFYKGNTPDISYYENISKEEYKNIYSENWSFHDETIKYLHNDLMSLYEVLVKANKQVFMDYDVNMTDNLTISGLATRIFLKDFYNNNIPVISKASIYRDIKQAYYGGITEVYKPYGKNLYYYDVNSLYPYVALQDMPGLECYKIQFFTDKQDLGNLFGFFNCIVQSPLDSYLGLLPVRTKSGINFPIGKWEGWYFSEELKFAQENGYNIQVIRGYSFSREANVFKDYISKVYNIKSNPVNNTQKSMAKSLLNNLLGRFGITLDKSVTKLVTTKTFDEKAVMNKITSYKKVAEDKFLVSYIPRLDYDIINSHKLDFIKIANNHKDQEIQSLNVTSVPISAAVTAYGRIHISKIKLYILSKGGKIYYSDTDSIVTNIELPDNMVNAKEIGKFKLEHNIDKGIFISGKIYWLRNNEGKIINKAKGVKAESLSYDDYVKLLNNISINTAVKKESKTDWVLGYVKININENVTINSNSYTKRIKIFKNGKWIDTKPVCINDIDKALVIYKNNKNLIPINSPISPISPIYSLPYLYSIKVAKTDTLKEVNKTNVISYNQLLLYLSSIIIIVISYIAYKIIEEDDFIETTEINNTQDKEIVTTNYEETTKDEVAINYEETTKDEETTYENDDYSDDTADTPSDDNSKYGIPTVGNGTKTLFDGFVEELAKIQKAKIEGDKTDDTSNTKNEEDRSRPSTSYTQEHSSRPSTSYTEDTAYSKQSPSHTEEVDKKADLQIGIDSTDVNNDKFSPNTLSYLDEEIKRNEENLEDINKVCKDQITKPSVMEVLMEERKYLLEQKSKHLNSVLQEAKDTPINDVDTDKLCDDITKLQSDVENLAKESERIKHRKLNKKDPSDDN